MPDNTGKATGCAPTQEIMTRSKSWTRILLINSETRCIHEIVVKLPSEITMGDAPSDPVKARSSFLSSYMSSHADTLVAYVLYFGKVKETPSTAKMTSIDQNKMDLSYQVKGSEEWKSVSVEFDPPLSGYEAVKPRLMQMKADAEEGLGMAKAPPLTTFSLKPGSFRALPVLFILAVFSLAPYHERVITKEEVPPLLYPLLPHANTALHFLT
ncbi:2810_t:CDS:2, partial [Acaulospora colombiana]